MLRHNNNKHTNPSATSGYTSGTRNTTTPVGGGISGKLKSPYFYTLASIVILTILSILILNLRLSLTNATGSEGSTDTGIATLSNVSIKQLGSTNSDGSSLTVTYSDGSTMSANKANNEILNNDIVVYEASYNVTTPGTITVSFTMPANSVIDEASVSTSAGCLTGSLSKQTVNGEQSYTNNKATCTLNPTTQGTTTWSIKTNPWGGNNAEIIPTLSVTGKDQPIHPDPVRTVGKGDYGIHFEGSGKSAGIGFGYNRLAGFSFGIYGGNANGTMLGVLPIVNGSWYFDVDVSELPDSWTIGLTNSNGGINVNSPIHGGDITYTKIDNDTLRVSGSGTVSAVQYCPTNNNGSTAAHCYYASGHVITYVPLDDLTADYLNVSLKMGDEQGVSSSEWPKLRVDGLPLTFSLSNRSYGNVNTYSIGLPVGWINAWNNDGVVYIGENLPLRLLLTGNYVPDNYATNVNLCVAWNTSMTSVNSVSNQVTGNTGGKAWSVEWGVVQADSSGTPALDSGCGEVGDAASNVTFFADRTDAQSYAESAGRSINALRIKIDQVIAGRDISLGNLATTIIGASDYYAKIIPTTYYKASNDQYVSSLASRTYRLVPGLLSHTITAKPSSTSPNTEDHITITPKTYNKDTNTKITVNLPSNLTPKDNSFYVSTYRLIKDLDYTITKAGNGGYTITFNTDQIATHSNLPITGEPAIMPGEPGNNTDLPIAKDNNGSGITRTPIEFDVLVDSNTPTPSTLTITSTTSGTGTNYASSTFKTATTNIAVATKKEFGYSLSTNASSIYAGDNLSYTLTNTNTLDDPTTNLTTINVLPYDGDSRGTTNLTSYQLANVRLTSNLSNTDNLTLYYTTDSLARDLELFNPASLATDSNLTWHELTIESSSVDNASGTDTTYTIPLDLARQITALKYTKPTLASGETITLTYTLTNIQATGSEAEPGLIGNSISYTMADVLSGPATNTSITTTNYLGTLLRLSLDKSTIETTLDPNTVQIGNGNTTNPDNLTNTLSLVARTTSGYNLTMQSATEETSLTMNLSKDTVDDTTKTYAIPTIDTKPTLGSSGWSITFGNPNDDSNTNWHSLPSSTATSLPISSTTTGGNNSVTLPVTYGVAVAPNTIAGTYTNRVVYTVTVGI